MIWVRNISQILCIVSSLTAAVNCDGYECGSEEKCCHVDGQYWCSPQDQPCYGKAKSNGVNCDGYECGSGEKCCHVGGQYWCSPQDQSCSGKTKWNDNSKNVSGGY